MPEPRPSQAARVTLTPTERPRLKPSPVPTGQGICAPFRKDGRQLGCILSFTAAPTQVVAGDTITFTWAVTGTTKVGLTLHHFEGVASGLGFRTWDNLPTTGSLTLQLKDLATGVQRFRLWTDDPGSGAWELIDVYYACSAPFFSARPPVTLGPLCQRGPAMSTAAIQQVFEHGLMVWLKSEETIYILFQPETGVIPQAWAFPNIKNLDAPEDGAAVTPPPGKYQPINALSSFWQNYHLRESLGWALAPQQPFTSTVQRGFRGEGLPLYFRLADGQIVYVVDSQDFERMVQPFWGYVSP